MRKEQLLKLWDTLELYLSGMLAMVALFFAFYQVLMRYVFNNAPEWAEESVLYLIIWSVMIMASKLVRDNEHIGADLLLNALPKKYEKYLQIAIAILAISFCIIVIYYGFKIVSITYGMDERSTTRLRFPMWIAYLSIPSGASLVCMSYLYRVFSLVFSADAQYQNNHRDK